MFLGCAPFHVSLSCTLYSNWLLCFHSGAWFSVWVGLVLRCWFFVWLLGFVFFCCVFLPGGIVAFWMKLQRLRMVEQ